ncbi:MAG: matrixin family metalloprotease [Polyangiaceae bacterium]|nr:matrixin family metalloprotease [Polyangiaceae bacterium]
MRRPDRALLVGALAATVLALPRIAGAYCRTSVCEASYTATLCAPPSPDDCGVPLFWAKPCPGFWVQRDASTQVDWPTVDAIAAASFATWANADCGNGMHPLIAPVDMGPVSCSAREYNQSGGNASVIVFRDVEWPYTGQGSTLALTTVTFNLDTGEIYDADLEVNGANIEITTGDVGVKYDLASILTHEAGHFLGLAHSPVAGATMAIEYFPGDTGLRSLSTDDAAGICAAYPPGPDPGACDSTPRHGFKDDCGPGDPPDEGCAVDRTPGTGGAGGAALVALAATVLAVRRRRR